MSQTLFVQFYDYSIEYNIYNLCNGFSDTYDLCKSKGEFYWMKHILPDYSKKYAGYDNKFIINKGTVFVSASYISHLYRVYLWAIRYPDINFIVGGPCIVYPSYKIQKQLPKNIILYDNSIEKYFNISEFSYNWKLEIPSQIKKNKTISYNYFLEKLCYWRKCNFCIYTNQMNIEPRTRKEFKYEFKDVIYNGKKEIRIGSDSLSSYNIKNFIANIPYVENLKQYRVFLRPSKKELESLKSIDFNYNMKFNMGLEFPSERMWNNMKKGFSFKYVKDTINYISTKKNFSMILNFIIGWNNLIEQDLYDMELFLENLNFSDNTTLSIHGLYILYNPKFTNINNATKIFLLDDLFFLGWKPKISKEQIKLNNKAVEILKSLAKRKQIEYSIVWT